MQWWHFPGGPVTKTLPSSAEGAGSIPGQGVKIPHALGPKNQDIKQKQYCNKFKDLKNGPHQKILKKKKMQENHYKMKSESQIPGVFHSLCSSADSSVGVSFPLPYTRRAAGCGAEGSEILFPEARYRYPCPLGGATAGWPPPQSPLGSGCSLGDTRGVCSATSVPIPPIQAPFCHRFPMTWCLGYTKCILYCQILVILIRMWYKF